MVTAESVMRNGHGEKLTARQQSALPELAGARSIQEAAGRSGIGRSTIYRWLQNPAFAAELRMWQQEVMEGARLKLTNHMMHAVDVLGGLLESENESIRRQAARDILTLVLHLEKHFEVVQRVEKVEEAVGLAEAVGVIK
jgi:hypothetical protein